MLLASMLLLAAVVATEAALQQVRRVVINGGTHGNEYTGVYVVRRLSEPAAVAELKERFPSLAIETMIANPQAVMANRRFVDDDLNRMFSKAALEDATSTGHEARRARELAARLGPKGAWEGVPGDGRSADLCIDMHTTTGNMGCCIIVDRYCVASLRACAYAATRWAEACAEDGEARLGIPSPARSLANDPRPVPEACPSGDSQPRAHRSKRGDSRSCTLAPCPPEALWTHARLTRPPHTPASHARLTRPPSGGAASPLGGGAEAEARFPLRVLLDDQGRAESSYLCAQHTA